MKPIRVELNGAFFTSVNRTMADIYASYYKIDKGAKVYKGYTNKGNRQDILVITNATIPLPAFNYLDERYEEVKKKRLASVKAKKLIERKDE